MKLLVATSYHDIKGIMAKHLSESGIKAEVTFVETLDNLITELKTDRHDFILTEYSIDGTDVWRLAKLVNSTQLAAHALPLYLIKDTSEIEVPTILAKAHCFSLVAFKDLGQVLQASYKHNLSAGYVRGRRQPDKPTLLIVEDDDNAAKIIQVNLQNEYDIDVAHTGESGLEKWLGKRHDLVLLDYMLPGIKGDSVLSKMMEVDKDQPLIVMTAYDRQEMNKDMILNGASEYLCKPFEINNLVEQCRSILSRAKLIYQAQYADSKNETLRDLFWLLEHALDHNQLDKAKRIASTIKLIFPDSPTEDEQALLMKLEF